MAYATAGQLCQYFDRRDLADLCAESETSVVSPAAVESNPIAANALEGASGTVRSTAMIAERYNADDLEALAAAQDGFLVWLTCALAFGILLTRRGVQRDAMPAIVVEAKEWLAQLREGAAIFDVSANEAAGLIHLTTPTVVELSNAGLATSTALGRFLPLRVVTGGAP